MKKTIDEQPLAKKHTVRNTAVGFLVGLLLGGLLDAFTGNFGMASIAGMFLGTVIGYFGGERFPLMEYAPRVVAYIAISGLLFFASLMLASFLLGRQSDSDLKIIIALIPSLFGAFFVLAIGYAISSLDEMQRRIQVEAIAIGFGITALIVLAIGFLGRAGMPQPDWLLAAPIMVGGWLIGKIWTRLRY